MNEACVTKKRVHVQFRWDPQALKQDPSCHADVIKNCMLQQEEGEEEAYGRYLSGDVSQQMHIDSAEVITPSITKQSDKLQINSPDSRLES